MAGDDTLAVRLAFARAARIGDAAAVQQARAAIVRAAVQARDDDAAVALVDTLYRSGEIGEQVSILSMLPQLPAPARFVALAIEACRTNAEPVFRAIATKNALPAAHFPAPAFHQMVLKAIFLGVPVAEIEGLHTRVDGELVRMVQGYASERRAAGRAVPDDVAHIVSLAENHR
ncbi:MAG TPA: EboA domain-containing protein [Nannocystaceae bacterium]|nr:EboA domain-containing protein [Nannocystaceae bacterium]